MQQHSNNVVGHLVLYVYAVFSHSNKIVDVHSARCRVKYVARSQLVGCRKKGLVDIRLLVRASLYCITVYLAILVI